MSDLDTLEDRVARDRAALSRSLDALSETLAPERLASNLNDSIRGYGGELGRQAFGAAKDNPAAFALVGAGIALLLTGAGSRNEPRRADPVMVAPEHAMDGFDERVETADVDMRAKMTGRTANPTALRMRAALDRGLNKLPPKARQRVLKARKAALDAQERLEAQAGKVANRSKEFHARQPLAVGALALGLGAVIGALLPGTRREDEILGARRDALMADARAALAEELDALHAEASTRIERTARAAGSSV